MPGGFQVSVGGLHGAYSWFKHGASDLVWSLN